jgi:hypothetical protein
MNKFRHGVGALVLFAVLVGLIVVIYDNGVVGGYGISKGDVKSISINGSVTSGNIVDQFKQMNLLVGINRIGDGLLKITAPSSSILDIVGGLMSAGIGALQTVLGLIIIPYDIMNIILTYYGSEVPGVIGGIVAMVLVYAAFIIISLYVRTDV